MLKTLLHDRITLVWLALVAATLASWTMAVGREFNPAYSGVAIIVIALIKVRLVGWYFMELREAPVWLRALFDGWVFAVASALVGLFLFA